MIVESATRVHEFVLEADRGLPPEQQTVFLIGTLNKRQFIDAMQLAKRYLGGPSGGQADDIEGFLNDLEAMLKLGLRGWKNLKNKDGADVPYDPAKIGELFEPVVLQELTGAVLDFNTIKGRDRKNST